MNYHLEKLRASLDAEREDRARTPVYLVLQTARAYQSLGASWEGLRQAVEQTASELEEILELVEEADRWSELCQESLSVLRDFREESELAEAIAAFEGLETEFLALDLTACYARLEEDEAWARISRQLDLEISEWALTAGHYSLILAAMESWLEGACPLALLDGHISRVHGQLHDYAATYLTPEEWTLEVATADQLLLEGLECWMQGLTRLREAVESGNPLRVPGGLELLLGGNHKLIQVERLAHLDGAV